MRKQTKLFQRTLQKIELCQLQCFNLIMNRPVYLVSNLTDSDRKRSASSFE